MQLFTRTDLFHHLESLQLSAGDDVLLHGGLFAFGPFEGGETAFFEALLEYFGQYSTIAVPTFTLWLEPGELYTLNTPSQRMGQFAEFIRQHPGAVRSRCPMHNHAAIGPKAGMLNQFSGQFSTGPGSDFELFYQQDFKNVFLGCTPKDSGTYLIHLEAMAEVPYREWVTLRRPVQWQQEEPTDFSLKYFGRRKDLKGRASDNVGVSVDLGIIQQLLIEQSVLIEQKLPLGRSYCAKIRDIHHLVIAELQKNPWLALGDQNA